MLPQNKSSHRQGRALVIIATLVVLSLPFLESVGEAQEGCSRAFFILFDKSASMKTQKVDRLTPSKDALRDVLQAGLFEQGDYILFAPFYDRIENPFEKRGFDPAADLPQLLSRIAGLQPAPWDPPRVKTYTYYDVALSLLNQKLAALVEDPLFSLFTIIFVTDGRDERPMKVTEKEYEKFRQIKSKLEQKGRGVVVSIIGLGLKQSDLQPIAEGMDIKGDASAVKTIGQEARALADELKKEFEELDKRIRRVAISPLSGTSENEPLRLGKAVALRFQIEVTGCRVADLLRFAPLDGQASLFSTYLVNAGGERTIKGIPLAGRTEVKVEVEAAPKAFAGKGPRTVDLRLRPEFEPKSLSASDVSVQLKLAEAQSRK